MKVWAARIWRTGQYQPNVLSLHSTKLGAIKVIMEENYAESDDFYDIEELEVNE